MATGGEHQQAYASVCVEDEAKVVASNITERLRRTQRVLQSVPDMQRTTDRKASKYSQAATVSGFLFMQKTTGQWKKHWCEFLAGELTYRTEEGSKKASGAITVSFCEAELPNGDKTDERKSSEDPPRGRELRRTPSEQKVSAGPITTAMGTSSSNLGGPARPPLESRKYDELYYSYLANLDASHAFKLFSPARIYVFRAETLALRDAFCNAILDWVADHTQAAVFQEKLDALAEINPLLREQFIVQVNHYNALVKALAKSSFMEDDLPITSTRKEKSGVLSMETPTEATKWADYYFVVFEGALFYYKDSKSTAPTGFITLKYASVHLMDPLSLRKNEFIFKVKTPLRTVICRTKHAVALSEWIACLENTLNVHMKKSAKQSKRSSLEVLQDINRLIAEVTAFKTCLANAGAVEAFRKLLPAKQHSKFDFYVAVEAARPKAGHSDDEAERKAVRAIHARFFDQEAKEPVQLPSHVAHKWAAFGIDPTLSLFEEALLTVEQELKADFDKFKKSMQYGQLDLRAEKPSSSADSRGVEPFDGAMLQSFVLKVKGLKRSKAIKFSEKQNVFTIGRDKSNNLVIEDSRVSRSHARVEYTDSQCEYIDLGSSCGSKLNGKPVLRAKLQPGDVIELGQSTLIFQLKKKGRFAFFGR